MFYIIIFTIFYPILLIISPFRKKSSKNLVIQTAKIGDYVNSSVIFNKLDKFDMIIDKVNYEFAKNNSKIENIYIINKYKKGLKNKLKLAFTIFWNNYKNVYILMPNSFNLFLAQFSLAKNKITIKHYGNKWYEKLLMIGMKQIIHTKEDLTIKSYLKMVNKNDIQNNWKNLPIIKPKKNLIDSNKFKVGISLSAGNKIKTIDNETWEKIFNILSKFDLEIYIFGLEDEEIYLNNLKDKIKNPYTSLLSKIPLKELPFYISKMNLYISSDTGNSYIADTFKVPLINFAGPCYMNEQKPINKNSLIIESNAKCTPFSFIFQAPYESKCDNLYKITSNQEKEILEFITKIYKTFFNFSTQN